jgi:hypothetical protein
MVPANDMADTDSVHTQARASFLRSILQDDPLDPYLYLMILRGYDEERQAQPGRCLDRKVHGGCNSLINYPQAHQLRGKKKLEREERLIAERAHYQVGFQKEGLWDGGEGGEDASGKCVILPFSSIRNPINVH